MSALFPGTVEIDPLECQRCGALVLTHSQRRHEAWHRSVDTDQTTDVTRHYTATGLPAAGCGADGPLTGLVCALPAGHAGSHRTADGLGGWTNHQAAERADRALE